MIKIKLLEHDIHRNETTFRPFVNSINELKDAGIEITDSEDYDFAFVGQASIIDKKVSLSQSIEKGIDFINKITGDYIIIDGQDSTSLIGTIDVFRESNAKLFLKNSYLKDFNLYKEKWVNGRIYWGKGNYCVQDIDKLKQKMKLTGCNWISTINPKWYDYDINNKKFDVSCMFSYPTKEPVYEHEVCQTDYYDAHRGDLLKKLGSKYNVAKLKNGEKIPIAEYYKNMHESKIVLAPLGYGEMAPRDIEAAMFGSILMKDDMSHIDTIPNIYYPNKVGGEPATYININYDLSNLEEKIDFVLSKYAEILPYLVENMRKLINESFTNENLAIHIHGIFSNLDCVETEE